ncbi:arginine-ornithine antiporter [Burkholderia sp. SRS-W-2-2016]|uniref:basic amino acid/polyamine antiporter n=1 Tax=Burkholderia sp. SRS-W-2-2016 TaxID=1926878 RepID=UPI00094B3842|nr:basic amino acid/polyamine antiporter [Burkholderia sp. SRS-W-2-2016]OLL27718.1 arginine-ornithine antiporter [Burkholderia sp. SRS-W-2-2016]
MDKRVRLSAPGLMAMVIGSMVGVGVFSLPQSLGRYTGVVGSLIGWTITGTGMLTLALIFQRLAWRKPELDVGVYTYARVGFGRYTGFLSAFGYWCGSCLGNVTYLVLIKSALAIVVPAFGAGNTLSAIVSSSALIWIFHFLILRGVKGASILNASMTVAKLLALGLFSVLVLSGFKWNLFIDNLWTAPDPSTAGLFGEVRKTMLGTAFVFLGVEGASVYSRHARERRDVGVATVLGFLCVLALMVIVTLLSYGVLPREQMGALKNPSLAGVLSAAVGGWGAVVVKLGLLLSVLGSYLAWTLLAAEILHAAGKSRTMPAFLGRENRNHVPVAAMWMTSLVIQVFLIITLFSKEAFTLAKEFTTSMNLIPYLLVAGYGLKLASSGESYAGQLWARRIDFMLALAGCAYALFLVYAGGLHYLLMSTVLYTAATAWFYLAERRKGRRQVFTLLERGLFAVVLGAALVASAELVRRYFAT